MANLQGCTVHKNERHWRGIASRRARAALICIVAGCSSGARDDSNVARGRGLSPVALTPAAEAGVYEAAARASFDVEPGLILLLHPQRLPRTAGYEGGDSVPGSLIHALRDRGVVRGTCQPKHDAPRDTPRCAIPQAGYVIRASPVVQAGRDTLQINFAAEAFGAATGARPQALRFERIYQMVGRGTSWQVVREARVKE